MKKYIGLLLLIFIIISCSKTSDQEYLDQSGKLLKENKVSEAVTSLEKLLEEYPESELAPKALQQLASIYQNQMIKDIKPMESFDKAQNYFYQSFEKDPDSPDAPKSLFLSGFILANDLKKYDEATTRLKLFLEKYNSHPLASSAKMELENMGLSPEEILKRSETAKK
jgi:TolA-binding protein